MVQMTTLWLPGFHRTESVMNLFFLTSSAHFQITRAHWSYCNTQEEIDSCITLAHLLGPRKPSNTLSFLCLGSGEAWDTWAQMHRTFRQVWIQFPCVSYLTVMLRNVSWQTSCVVQEPELAEVKRFILIKSLAVFFFQLHICAYWRCWFWDLIWVYANIAQKRPTHLGVLS